MPTLTQYKLRLDSPFDFVELDDFRMWFNENEHTVCEFGGVLEESNAEWVMRQNLDGQIISFYDDDTGKKIFSGVLQQAEVNGENGYHQLTAMALSGTIKLDITKKTRSFQNVTDTYGGVIRKVLSEYSDADFMMAAEDHPIGDPLIQYDETDWEFIKRLASHFDTSLMPDVESGLPRFWLGLRKGDTKHEMQANAYKAVIEKKFLEVGGNQLGFSRSMFLSYAVTSFANYKIGDRVDFKDTEYYICRKGCKYHNDVLVYTYVLGLESLISRQKYYNEKLTGRAILGKVLAADGGTVKVHLNIDTHQDVGTAYPFSWKPPTGNLMYLMPKVGTEVSVYFSNPAEESAKAINCVREAASTNSKGMQDTSKRGLSSEHGKNLLLHPDKVGLQSSSGGPLSVMLDDAEGISLATEMGIVISGKEGVSFDAPKIVLETATQIGIFYTGGADMSEGGEPPTCFIITPDAIMSVADGGNTNVIAADCAELPAFEDVPEEGEFDWGGLLGNVLAGLAVVACVCLIAVAVVGTAGAAGPIIAGAAIAGATAVGTMAVGDVMRGNVSSTEDYMKEAFISTCMALITGAAGQGIGAATKALTTLAKAGKVLKVVIKVGLKFAEGFIISGAEQLLRMGLDNSWKDTDWKMFFKNCAMGGATNVISAGFEYAAQNIPKSKSPFFNALLTVGGPAVLQGGENLLTQLAAQLIYNGEIDFSALDWSSIAFSAQMGLFQGMMDFMKESMKPAQANQITAGDPEQPEPLDGNNAPRTEGGADDLNMDGGNYGNGGDNSGGIVMGDISGEGDGESWKGTVKGEEVELPGVYGESIDYTKRDRDSYNQLRREYKNTGKKEFLQSLLDDPIKRQELLDAGLTESDLLRMADGYNPPGYQVHHKLPLDDGGTNDFENLVLIENKPFHTAVTNWQNSNTRGMVPGDTKSFEWPTIPGSIYPPGQ